MIVYFKDYFIKENPTLFVVSSIIIVLMIIIIFYLGVKNVHK